MVEEKVGLTLMEKGGTGWSRIDKMKGCLKGNGKSTLSPLALLFVSV
jgi:hypothetical protein